LHPFHSLFTDEPEIEYVPDAMGRLGQGGFVVMPDGKAKVFEVRSVWRRKFTWRLRIVRDPNTHAEEIIGVGKPRWVDAK
jgi:hypothetical protein